MSSIIDGVPVSTNSDWDKLMQRIKKAPPSSKHVDLVVAGNCPKCGSPIYGQARLATEAQPEIRRTCDCRLDKGSIADTMLTK